jgi:translation initiation factor 5A
MDYELLCYLIYLNFIMQIKDGFAEGKDLVVSVMSAMGEEQICALKDIGPK